MYKYTTDKSDIFRVEFENRNNIKSRTSYSRTGKITKLFKYGDPHYLPNS